MLSIWKKLWKEHSTERVGKKFGRQLFPVLLVIGVTIGLSLEAQQSIMEREEEKCWQILQDSADEINSEIRDKFENNRNILRLVAGAIVKENHFDSYDILENHLKDSLDMTMFSRIDILYPDNMLLLQTGKRVKARDDISFQEIIEEGVQVSKRRSDEETGDQVIQCYMPIVKDGATEAILIGVIDCTKLPDIFKTTIYGGKAKVCIVDYTDGNIIMDDWHDELGNIYDMEDRIALKEYRGVSLKEDIRNAKSGVTAYVSKTNGVNSYMYYTPIGIFTWEMLIIVQENVAFSNLLSLQNTLFRFGLVEALLLLIYFFWNLVSVKRLLKSKLEAEKQLRTSTTLIECVKELSTYSDINCAIDNLLRIVNKYFKGDRTYLFEIDYENQVINNTYEYVIDGVTKEIENLQKVPLYVISDWLERFEKEGIFYISDREKEIKRDTLTYKLLEEQNIHNLIAVPLTENNVITGFMGVDNPKDNFKDLSLLTSIQFFVLDSMDRKKRHEELEKLSFQDMLTGCNNRNKYNHMIEKFKQEGAKRLGIAYFDLNGLKQVNDKLGHKAGDDLICHAAYYFKSVFGENMYRIGGDEFVAMVPNIEKEEFCKKVKKIRHFMEINDISLSCGISWREDACKLKEQIEEADRRMYQDKRQFYDQNICAEKENEI